MEHAEGDTEERSIFVDLHEMFTSVKENKSAHRYTPEAVETTMESKFGYKRMLSLSWIPVNGSLSDHDRSHHEHGKHSKENKDHEKEKEEPRERSLFYEPRGFIVGEMVYLFDDSRQTVTIFNYEQLSLLKSDHSSSIEQTDYAHFFECDHPREASTDGELFNEIWNNHFNTLVALSLVAVIVIMWAVVALNNVLLKSFGRLPETEVIRSKVDGTSKSTVSSMSSIVSTSKRMHRPQQYVPPPPPPPPLPHPSPPHTRELNYKVKKFDMPKIRATYQAADAPNNYSPSKWDGQHDAVPVEPHQNKGSGGSSQRKQQEQGSTAVNRPSPTRVTRANKQTTQATDGHDSSGLYRARSRI